MNVNKNLLLIGAIVGIGLFVLPSTLSMFAGQHAWYNLNNDKMPCQKCHFIEMDEIASTNGPHSINYNLSRLNDSAAANASYATLNAWDDAGTIQDRCYGCHQVQNVGANDFNNSEVHAAVRVECIWCHPWVEYELTNTAAGASHGAFYNDTNVSGTDYLMNANKACVGCHTHVGVNISWQRLENVTYNVTMNTSTGDYNVTWNATDTMGYNESLWNSTDGYP